MGKTVIVTNSPGGGGAERTMNSLANLLHENQLNVSVFPINAGDDDAVVPKCEVIAPVRGWKAGLLPTFMSFLAFRSKIVKANPSLVIANCELPELYSVFIPLRIQLIFVEHTSKPWRKHRALGFLVRLLASLRGAHWVLVSDHLRKKRLFQRPTSVILNLLSVADFKLAKGDSQSPRLIFIGRVSEEKDPSLFLEIVRLAGYPAMVIGNGILAKELAAESSLQNLSVLFTGHINDPWSQIHRNDVVVITSQYEGDGLVLLEAISRDLPILVRDIPDLRRFGLPESNYFKTAPEATKALVEFKLNSASLRVPSDITARIISTRNEKKILNSWLELIGRFTAPLA